MPFLGVLLASSAAQAGADTLPEVKPLLLVQTTAILMDQDRKEMADPGGYGDPEDDMGFKLQTARLGFEGSNATVKYGVTVGLSSPYDSVTEAQGASTDLGIVDAYGGYAPIEDLWIVGGLQKVPVSREQLMSSHDLTFSRRAVPTKWLTPSRDLGVVIDSTWSFMRFRLGAFNGSGDLRGDDNKGKLVATRVEGQFGDGDAFQTFGNVDGLTLAVGVDGWMNDETALETTGYGIDFMIRFEGLAVMGEARFAEAQPKDGLIDIPAVFDVTKRQGMTVQAGYTIGQIEPAVRFSTFDDDKDVEDVGDVMEGMTGVTWHSEKDNVRAGVGYIARLERGPTKKENDAIQAWFQLKL